MALNQAETFEWLRNRVQELEAQVAAEKATLEKEIEQLKEAHRVTRNTWADRAMQDRASHAAEKQKVSADIRTQAQRAGEKIANKYFVSATSDPFAALEQNRRTAAELAAIIEDEFSPSPERVQGVEK